MPIPPANPTLDGATWRDTRVNLQVGVVERIYQNPTRDISGTDHQFEDIDVTNTVFRSFLPMDGDHLRVVRTTGDAVTDGTSLLNAYATATLLTPNGAPISATNRVVILLLPGTYDLGITMLACNTLGIDIMGLGGREDVVITSQVATPGQGTIYQTADNVRFYNFTLKNTATIVRATDSTDPSCYAVAGDYVNTIMRNVRITADIAAGAPWPTRLGQGYTGLFEDCMFVTSLPFRLSTAAGIFRRCEFDGGFQNSSGTGPGGGRALFESCSGGGWGASTLLANHRFCNYSFGSFNGATTGSHDFYDCNFGDQTFFGGGRPGSAYNCTFVGLVYFALTTALGDFYHCVFKDPLGCDHFGGRMEGCYVEMRDDPLTLGDNAVILDTTIRTTADPAVEAAGVAGVTVTMAHCRLPAGLAGNVTNTVATPYNVIDASI